MREKLDISVERHTHDGFTLSAMHNGYYRHKRYIGYTLKEAKQDFRQWVKEQN